MNALDSLRQDKLAQTLMPIHPLLARRFSPRSLDATREVSLPQLQSLLEAAAWSPSCFNDQPWRVVIGLRDGSGIAAAGWQAMLDALAEGNRAWAQRAPVLLTMGAEGRFRHNGEANRWAAFDAGAAALALSLEAVNQGLVAHAMGGFDTAALAAALDLPQTVTPMAVVAVGHQGAAEQLEGWQLEAERARRERQPLPDWCQLGRWGEPWVLQSAPADED